MDGLSSPSSIGVAGLVSMLHGESVESPNVSRVGVSMEILHPEYIYIYI